MKHLTDVQCTFLATLSAALAGDGGGPFASWGVIPKDGEGVSGTRRSGPEGILGLVASLGGGARGVPAFAHILTGCQPGFGQHRHTCHIGVSTGLWPAMHLTQCTDASSCALVQITYEILAVTVRLVHAWLMLQNVVAQTRHGVK